MKQIANVHVLVHIAFATGLFPHRKRFKHIPEFANRLPSRYGTISTHTPQIPEPARQTAHVCALAIKNTMELHVMPLRCISDNYPLGVVQDDICCDMLFYSPEQGVWQVAQTYSP
jgi:hypothetical protein